MAASGIACVSKPFFLIVMNFSLRSRNLEVKRSGSVLETRDRAVSPRVTASGGEDNKKKLDAACFSASCGRALIHFASRVLTSRESLVLREGCEKNYDMNARVGQDASSIYATQYLLKTCASYSPVCLMYGQN